MDIPHLDPLSADTPVVLRRELLAAGWTDDQLRKAVRTGQLRRVRQGAFVDTVTWEALTERQRHVVTGRAALRQAKTPCVLSHVSALAAWGAPYWGLDLDRLHLTRLDRRSGRRGARINQHRGAILDSDWVRVGDIAVTSPERTCLDLACLATSEQALCVTDWFLHEGLTTRQALLSRYHAVDETGNSMTQWAGSLATDIVLTIADPLTESVGESRLIHLCWRFGLTLPQRQVEVRDADGRLIGRVDFAWPERRVFLEFDGRIKYERGRRAGETEGDVVFREKRREDAIVEATGWRCVRVTWADLNDASRTAGRISRAIALAA